jgi:oligopeptide/dipeptide ABC transporter ATP-binding protein
MYLGKVVEIAESDSIYQDAKHPYTRALLSAVPMPDTSRKKERVVLEGDVPSPVNPPSGCSFHPRCSYREAICDKIDPLLEFGAGGHGVSCHVFGPGKRA